MWEAYNYSSVFKEPVRIKDLGNLGRLPFSVALVDVATFFIIMGIEAYFLGDMIASLQNKLDFSYTLFYFAVPLFSVTTMNRIKPDGKKIYFYLIDVLKFIFLYVLLNRTYQNFKPKEKHSVEEMQFDLSEVKICG
ncbi:MAG TPA: conjugal transfer protein [Candidatus Enterococcus stercoripullorum]|nr:conjugal transfer protein [Candidatus Enterococcus stercoripullorum]